MNFYDHLPLLVFTLELYAAIYRIGDERIRRALLPYVAGPTFIELD